MFEFNPNTYKHLVDQTRPPTAESPAYIYNHAISLFSRARRRAGWQAVKSSLFRQDRLLCDLECLPADSVYMRHYGGVRGVNLNNIGGSLNRTLDFDLFFNPLNNRSQERWIRIAIARLMNVPLEPIVLIQVDRSYYVQDGHHRISVARALGEEAADADVTIWETSDSGSAANELIPIDMQTQARV